MTRFSRYVLVVLSCLAFTSSAFAMPRVSSSSPRRNTGAVGGRSRLARGPAGRLTDNRHREPAHVIQAGRVSVPDATVQALRGRMNGATNAKAKALISRAARFINHIMTEETTTADQRVLLSQRSSGNTTTYRLKLGRSTSPSNLGIYTVTVRNIGMGGKLVITDVAPEGLRAVRPRSNEPFRDRNRASGGNI